MKANDRAGKGNFVIKLQHTLYSTEPDLVLKKDGQTLRAVHSDGHSDHITLHMVDQIVTYSGGSITPDVLGACATAGVGFSSFSQCGRFQFRIVGATTGNVLLRKRQYEQIWLSICCRPREGKEAKRRRWRKKRAAFEEAPRLADAKRLWIGGCDGVCGLHLRGRYLRSEEEELPSPRGVRIASAKGYKSV